MVGLEEVAHHADAQALHTVADAGGEVGDWPVDAGRIFRIVAGHGLQQQGAIFNCPGHRTRMVHAERKRQHARTADQAIGGLDAGDAAQRRRTADRAAGIRTGAAQHHSGRYGGTRA
jgi:hypothetical protein